MGYREKLWMGSGCWVKAPKGLGNQSPVETAPRVGV